MMDTAVYFVSPNIAIRAGKIDDRYVIKDGRYVLNEKDLNRITFSTNEIIGGLKGVKKVTPKEAEEAIKENGYTFGDGTSDAYNYVEEEETDTELVEQPVEPEPAPTPEEPEETESEEKEEVVEVVGEAEPEKESEEETPESKDEEETEDNEESK